MVSEDASNSKWQLSDDTIYNEVIEDVPRTSIFQFNK